MTLEGRFSHGGNIKTFVAVFAVCFMNIWAISKPGMVLWLLQPFVQEFTFSRHLELAMIKVTGDRPRDVMFSLILPLKSKIRINVIPSPGFKLVVLIGFRDDSWVFLNVFLNGYNIKRVHLCSKLRIMKIKNHSIA